MKYATGDGIKRPKHRKVMIKGVKRYQAIYYAVPGYVAMIEVKTDFKRASEADQYSEELVEKFNNGVDAPDIFKEEPVVEDPEVEVENDSHSVVEA